MQNKEMKFYVMEKMLPIIPIYIMKNVIVHARKDKFIWIMNVNVRINILLLLWNLKRLYRYKKKVVVHRFSE